ncbi:Uu.00g146090.m01.CDS01 [Anthostomella pinea]|uniref:Uu.00g146090.m01.CDS01 n=1 Tax=Anthostomella pinea TaxID=933095 RepID=A0AAI8VS23_9PEZI|nr:Uu.00g146090.m01.CDS01 [Anthostomella pinea]
MALFSLVALSVFASFASAKCYDHSPAFPMPLWQHGTRDLASALHGISEKLKAVVSDNKYEMSSFSVELTSNMDTLWSQHHTARKQNATRPGTTHVSGDSQYRIASVTKSFTVLGVLYQHAAGNLSLDDPVLNYIPELSSPDSGKLPWKDITIRALASQISGLPREMGQGDLFGIRDPTDYGLPPVEGNGLPTCYWYNHFVPCNKSELFRDLKTKDPLFAPNQKSTYGNVNFALLGLVLENVTGVSYSDYMRTAIFEPLDLTSTFLDAPSDENAVLPVGQYYWGVDGGVLRPSGGIYTSSSDLSKYLRYVLTHFNALATGVNWFMPASWATGLRSFYGMPWEIFRTEKILPETDRPVTLVTKGGGQPDYFSKIIMMPEYGLGLTILTAGHQDLLGELQEILTTNVVRAAEEVIWRDVEKTYTGTYLATNSSLNSSLELASSPSTSLIVNTFISNGTNVFNQLLPGLHGSDEHPWRAQLVPTLLYKNETAQQGEVWRLLVTAERMGEESGVWDDFCSTDIDVASYAGLPVNEVVFWHEEDVIELPAWRVKLRRRIGDEEQAKLVVQELR